MISDPWWIFTIANLFWNIKFRYELGFAEIVRVSPRFAILLLCMTLSIICIVIDLLSVTPVIPIGVINPFWKFAFVFKCFTDSIILDDFKSALDALSHHRRTQILPFSIPANATLGGAIGLSQTELKWPGRCLESPDKKSISETDIISRRVHVGWASTSDDCSSPTSEILHIENVASRSG